jgi:hypothetical protein
MGIRKIDNGKDMKYNTGDMFVSNHNKSILLVLKSKDNFVWLERRDKQYDKLIQSVYTLAEVDNYCDNGIWKHYPVKK